ncbi:hypothetical protein [Mycobacterium sp. 852013-50091_SCH5140682]|uniref:hypothetical protein n=1 Tax=Mycobacterium sp. 852013-50091_SCH5140682 TaxID=1834109 RepID=UPI0012E9FD0C|nr:hypothetical protein [Mycobacterium sp. 852013-50091_SCH5140682]
MSITEFARADGSFGRVLGAGALNPNNVDLARFSQVAAAGDGSGQRPNVMPGRVRRVRPSVLRARVGAAVVRQSAVTIEFAEFAADLPHAIGKKICIPVNFICFAGFVKINVRNGEFARGSAGPDECIIVVIITLTFPCRIARSGICGDLRDTGWHTCGTSGNR